MMTMNDWGPGPLKFGLEPAPVRRASNVSLDISPLVCRVVKLGLLKVGRPRDVV